MTAIGAVCSAVSRKGYAEGYRDGVEDAEDNLDMKLLSEVGETIYKCHTLEKKLDEVSAELEQAADDYDALLADYEEMLIERETAKFYESISGTDDTE